MPPLLLLTRPEPASRRFLAELEALAGRRIAAVMAPVLAIEPVPVALAERPAALVLTSENGAGRAGALGLAGLTAWCVGPRTAHAARAAGLRAIEAGPDAEGLVARLLAERPEGPLLHLRGEHAAAPVAARLRAGGIEVGEAVAYRQRALPPTGAARAALGGERPVVLPLFSPRSAALVAGWGVGAGAPLHVVAISPAAARAAAPLGARTLDVAARPDGAAMAGATLRRLEPAGEPRLEGATGAD
jgi:uroporphyrinogen-III synthase